MGSDGIACLPMCFREQKPSLLTMQTWSGFANAHVVHFGRGPNRPRLRDHSKSGQASQHPFLNGLYVGLVIALQFLLRGLISHNSDIAIGASTLAIAAPTGCATRWISQAQWLWTFLRCIHGFCTEAELLQYRQQASDVTEVARETASQYTVCLLKSHCASRGLWNSKSLPHIGRISSGSSGWVFRTSRLPTSSESKRSISERPLTRSMLSTSGKRLSAGSTSTVACKAKPLFRNVSLVASSQGSRQYLWGLHIWSRVATIPTYMCNARFAQDPTDPSCSLRQLLW